MGSTRQMTYCLIMDGVYRNCKQYKEFHEKTKQDHRLNEGVR